MVQRATPGGAWGPPKATDWNDIGEATEIYLRHHRTRDSHQLKQWILPTDWVWCQSGTTRRAGEVLEVGEHLLTEVDPFALWFVGQAPTLPIRQSTHGVLRVACKSGELERVQVSGVVRAWVNVTDDTHNFCDAADGLYVLQSNNRGPHKITWKPSGTGEMSCAVLLYADNQEDLIAEAYAMTDVCPTDPSGTGTGSGSGSQAPEITVYDFRIQPFCTLVDPPPKCTNPRNHRWPLGSLLTLTRQRCEGGVEEWRVIDVELRRYCALVGIDDRESCLVSAALHLGGEWCPPDEPMEACIIVQYTDCTAALPPCDTDWIYNSNTCCSGGTAGTGTGSGTS